MKVTLCVATRGRPSLLRQSLTATLGTSVCDETRIVVGCDEDASPDERPWEITNDKIVVSVAPREDSLGAKYNRCQRAAPADLYVVGCDDTVIATPGWDARLLEVAAMFTDRLGIIYFGNIPGVFKPGIAVTHGIVEHAGYFMQPYTPFWWHDTWIDEIGHMIGRIVRADLDVVPIGKIGASRGCREIDFWARFFDETRPLRRQTADGIIDASNDQPWRKLQLRQNLPFLEHGFLQRNSNLRSPDEARKLEAIYGFDAPADERYMRVKTAALNLLSQQLMLMRRD